MHSVQTTTWKRVQMAQIVLDQSTICLASGRTIAVDYSASMITFIGINFFFLASPTRCVSWTRSRGKVDMELRPCGTHCHQELTVRLVCNRFTRQLDQKY